MLRATAVCTPFGGVGGDAKLDGVSSSWGCISPGRASLGLERADSGRESGNTGMGKVIPGPAAEPGIKSRCAELVLGLYSPTWLH